MKKISQPLLKASVEKLLSHFPRRNDFTEFLAFAIRVSRDTKNDHACEFFVFAMEEFLLRWSDKSHESKKDLQNAFVAMAERFEFNDLYYSLLTWVSDYTKEIKETMEYENEYVLNLHQGIHWVLTLFPFLTQASEVGMAA